MTHLHAGDTTYGRVVNGHTPDHFRECVFTTCPRVARRRISGKHGAQDSQRWLGIYDRNPFAKSGHIEAA